MRIYTPVLGEAAHYVLRSAYCVHELKYSLRTAYGGVSLAARGLLHYGITTIDLSQNGCYHAFLR